MKFFTPDLLVRFGSEDDSVADAAQADWEKADLAYQKRLKRIYPSLPRAAKRFVKTICLHDAKVRILAMSEDRLTISLFMELDEPRDHTVMLHYILKKKPEWIKHSELQEPGTPVEWLYDEFDVGVRGGRKQFTHSVLFTGGFEMRLVFHTMRVELFEKTVMPASAEGAEDNLDTLVAG